MKIRKTVSERVISANRANAQESTGPKDCGKVKHNAVRHGLRAKQILFEDEDEEKQYSALLEELEVYHQPDGPIEWMLVEEIARCRWRLQVLSGWEVQEIKNRRMAAKAILQAVAENYDEEQLPLFTTAHGSNSAAQLGWDCQELIVRTGTRSFEQEETSGFMDKADKSGHVQIQAKLNTSMESIMRYEAAMKRDLYRAIRTLHDIQKQRQEKQK
jgi:hypothetical protein